MTAKIASLLLLVFFVSDLRAAIVLNGDFSTPGVSPDPFANWSTDDLSFDRPVDGGGFALFNEEGAVGSSQLAQAFALQSGALKLSFELKLTSLELVPVPGSIPDSFQVTLFNSANIELFPANSPLFTAFYSVDNDGVTESFDPTFVTRQALAGGRKLITLDLSSLTPQTLVLDFLLNGSQDGHSTQVQLDNVGVITSVPEPSSFLLLLVSTGFIIRASRRNRHINKVIHSR